MTPENQNQKETEREIYRKRSLERYRVSDQIDQLFIPVKGYTWIIWVNLTILLSVLIIWLFFGSIPVIIEGRAIVMSAEGLYSIQAKTSGVVSKLYVKPGDLVYKGQLVAKIDDVQEKVKYYYSTERLQKVKRELAQIRKQIALESEAEKEAIQKQLSAGEFAIAELEKTILKWKKEVDVKEKLYREKLISLRDLEETKQILGQNMIELETTKATIATLQANLGKLYRQQELKEKERALLQAEQENQILKLSLEYSNIYSKDNGIVLELVVSTGDRVQPGTPLMHLEYAINKEMKHILYGYVSLKDGKKIRKGIRVDIDPSTVNTEEYGSLIGTVKDISLFAVSKENIANLIQNDSLVNYLIAGENAVTQLVIEPVLDLSTPTGYKWTSGKGPSIPITTGTVCKLKVIAERVSPLYNFFSLWRLEKIKNELESFWKDFKNKLESFWKDHEQKVNENDRQMGYLHFFLDDRRSIHHTFIASRTRGNQFFWIPSRHIKGSNYSNSRKSKRHPNRHFKY